MVNCIDHLALRKCIVPVDRELCVTVVLADVSGRSKKKGPFKEQAQPRVIMVECGKISYG